jgi:hypothetical protein
MISSAHPLGLNVAAEEAFDKPPDPFPPRSGLDIVRSTRGAAAPTMRVGFSSGRKGLPSVARG